MSVSGSRGCQVSGGFGGVFVAWGKAGASGCLRTVEVCEEGSGASPQGLGTSQLPSVLSESF